MKISYRTHPILEKLHKGSLGIMPMFENDKKFFDIAADVFVSNWKFYHKFFQEEINVISKPFREACAKAENKLVDLWSDILINDTSDFCVNGCYIIGDFVYMINYEVKKGSEDQEIIFYIFDKDGIPLAMLIDSAKYEVYQNIWISSCFGIKNNHTDILTWIYSKLKNIVILKMFKSYAEVETKMLPAGKIVKDINCKYVNDTKLNILHIDSKWFTTLIKSDSFNVRGHFRLQPKKKNGEWTKELIWINDFQKTGYTAPARKLTAFD